MPVRLASASATADVGTSPVERRTTVRGGRTFHDDGSCGGFAPLDGTGGGTIPVDDDAAPGTHPARPSRSAADRRTVAPGGRPTVGTPEELPPAPIARTTPEPAPPVAGWPPPGPESDGRPPAPPGAPVAGATGLPSARPDGGAPSTCTPAPLADITPALDRPTAVLAAPGSPLVVLPEAPDVVRDAPAVRHDVLAVPADAPVVLADAPVVLADAPVVLADAPVVLADGDPARRRTGDAAERIDAPAADAPPAAATTVGDMSRSAWPGAASRRCTGASAALLLPAGGLHARGEPAVPRAPTPDGSAAPRAPPPDELAVPCGPPPDELAVPCGPPLDGPAVPRAPTPEEVAGCQAPASDRFADAYAAAAPVGGA
ncbi:hypothetical protein [Cellulomonas sp. Leaf334]|uniref:hypothetical protein n=1 Tax=Cellulomonas sp. Leaf334 TaxID=1736339 RepID=UPI0006FB6D08|nr:hypothetical protein [Cellulomonas sp. Leaf334]KQR12106.1 hypothetical protein ASF78_13115 [Cellulomonas sp. Leaf334]